MTLKLQVASSRKISTADFASHGAHCGIELALDPLAMQQPEIFGERLTRLFDTCREAVQDELDRQVATEPLTPPTEPAPFNRIAHETAPSNGNGTRRAGRSASEKQLRFVRTLASGIQGMDNNVLETLCERMFNSTVDRLSSTEASNLIDTLRSIKKGTITLERLLSVGGTNEF